MFCTDEEPCATHASKRTKPSPPKLPVSSPTVSEPPVTTPGREDTSPEWFGPAEPVNRYGTRLAEQEAIAEDVETLRIRQALLNCESLMSKPTFQKYKHLMYPPKDITMNRRAAEVRKSLESHQRPDA